MAIWIKSVGTRTEVQPENGKDFKLNELQRYVGGYIELLTLTGFRFMVVNEEGKLLGLPINAKASAIYGYDTIVGDVLICNDDEIK